MNVISLKTIIILCLALTACGKREEDVDDKDRAVDYLNQQRYDDAATVLEGLVADSPKDGELRLLLASAHAGAVGFNVIEAFSAFEPLLFAKPKGQGLNLVADPGAAEKMAAKPFEQELLRFVDQFVTQFRSVTAVPFIVNKHRPRLIEAITQLGAVEEGDSYYLRGKSYRAVLNALQFLNLLRDALPQGDGEALSFRSVMCGVNVQTFTANLEVSTNYLISSVQDISDVYAVRQKPLPKSVERLRDTSIDLFKRYEDNKNAVNEAQLAFNAAKKTYCP